MSARRTECSKSCRYKYVCMEKPSCQVINVLKDFPINVRSRVTLTGVAAHAMTPHQGSGTGQAIEDVYVLATLFAHRSLCSIPFTRLKVYETERLPHGNDIQCLSHLDGKLYEFAVPRFANLDLGAVEEGKLREVDARKLWEIGHAAVEIWNLLVLA